MEKRYYHYQGEFSLESGQSLPELTICYHISKAAAENAPVIWVCHALTANSAPEEWWDRLCGPGKFLDTQKYLIVCANMLGSCYGSTGPQSVNPLTGKPYYLDFPQVTIRDMIKAHELLREHLGISHIDLIIGGSNGGMQVLEWLVSNPGLFEQGCLLACSARVSPWMTAYNESQRMAIEADQSFRACKSIDGGAAGLEAARTIALISYRSYKGYEKTQSENDTDCVFAQRAASYQRYQGQKLRKRFNAYSYYSLSKSLDSHNVGYKRGGVEEALSRVTAKVLCIGIDSDGLFPFYEVEYIAKHIPNADFVKITSDFGHDGFLLENKQIEENICRYLNLAAHQ